MRLITIKTTLRSYFGNYWLIKLLLFPLYFIPFYIYYHILHFYFLLNIKRNLKNHILYFHAHDDYGSILESLNYLKCLQNSGCNLTLFVFSPNFSKIKTINRIINPNLKTIYPINFPFKIFNKAFGYILKRHIYTRIFYSFTNKYPDARYLYNVDYGVLWKFSDQFNKKIYSNFTNHRFEAAFKKTIKVFEKRYDIYIDSIKSRAFANQIIPDLKNFKNLYKEIDFSRQIILLNINSKNYEHAIQNTRKIEHFERYNRLIDFLIQKNFLVVLQGTQEQPIFRSRPGFFDYAHSRFQSIENDLLLFSKCYFFISSKSGSEMYSNFFNTPTLGLNYTELTCMNENKKFRFYPKHIKNSSGKYLSWNDLLRDPIYFQIGRLETSNQKYIFEEMTETELINAATEFLSLIKSSNDRWLNYTKAQKEFKKCLRPYHLDLFLINGVPCDSYLNFSEPLT